MNMKPQPIYLDEYQPPKFTVDKVDLHFDLYDTQTDVKSTLRIRRLPHAEPNEPLVLDGEALQLQALYLENKPLKATEYTVDDKRLTVFSVPDEFVLETHVTIKPHENTQLMGLYRSKGNYCTQCEPHGFRRITYFIDRPDVLSRFTTTITADLSQYPNLLSNGNLVETKTLENGRHRVKWDDPSLKPCYLFALVAGDFDQLTDTFTTHSGRTIDLHVYVEKGCLDQTHHAMACLKRAMRWDEVNFGREYELDIYMVVAVSDFNMGAMENKGLNIFNSQYILATPETSTDKEFIAVEEVIGHEYFHNWTGNRITLRDWFQLSLKEGLTIFRDQWFTADMTSKAVKRIEDANIIRAAQFTEDAGPTAHPVRPDSYIEINNFYTLTVYHKGAELIRMMYYLIGGKAFRRAMDLYFERHDGQAVTTEDFVKAMEDGGDIDLSQFRRWYTQAGTPELTIRDDYDDASKTYTLDIEQYCPPTPGQPNKSPMMIPLALGLVGRSGEDLPLQLKGEDKPFENTTRVLTITDNQQRFHFINVKEKPIPSLLRHFSAPVRCHYEYTDEALVFLLKHDQDDLNRWDAGQRLMTRYLRRMVDNCKRFGIFALPDDVIQAIRDVLNNDSLDSSFIARAISLPNMTYLVQLIDQVDMDALIRTYDFFQKTLAEQLYDDLWSHYQRLHDAGAYVYSSEAVGRRELKNVCLSYLLEIGTQAERDLAFRQYNDSDNMTDTMGALTALNKVVSKERESALGRFYQRWRYHPLVLDKWFALEASSRVPGTLKRVQALLQHPDFQIKNPNKVRALIGSFSRRNLRHFHARDGSGYRFLRDQVLKLDAINPQIAARLVEPLTQWHQFDSQRQHLMYQALQSIAEQPKLSNDLYEQVTKSLAYQAEAGQVDV